MTGRCFKSMKYRFFVIIFLFISALITSCGGGGGGGGMVAFAPTEDGSTNLHNGGGNGGWGTGNTTGTGIAPNSPTIEDSEARPLISQMAALDVSTVDIRLNINNVEQSLIVADETTPTSVLPKIKPGYVVYGSVTIHLRDGTTRTAYLDETEAQLNGVLVFKVPYFYTCYNLSGAQVAHGTYFARDGINLAGCTPEGFGWQCQEDGTTHMGSFVDGVRGDITLLMVDASGLPPAKMFVKTDFDTSNSSSYEIDDTKTQDHGSTASRIGSIVIPPLPQGAMYTETQSNTAVTWDSYTVTVTVDGTPYNISFTSTDTKAASIENVPVGATVSASAQIGVPASAAYPGDQLNAASTASVTLQSGASPLTMYAQYPLTCQVQSAHVFNASITGTSPAYYTNTSPATALPATTPFYTNISTNKKMRFIGWALANTGLPAINSTSIPADGTYKGKLDLYAAYGECSLSITGAALPPTGDPVITTGDTLALTAVPEGFPDGQTITYSWRIVPPNAPLTATATISGSGANATVTPVAGASGSATVEVTATCGALTASAMKNVTVAGVSISGDTVIKKEDTGKTLTASLAGYSGSVDYSFELPAGACISLSGSGASRTIIPVSGGKTKITVKATADGRIFSAEKEIYVLEVQISGESLSTDSSSPTLMAEGGSPVNLTASLAGISDLEGAEFTWEVSPAPSDPSKPFLKLTPGGAGNASCSLEPKQADDAVNTLTAKITYRGVEVKAERYIKVIGLRLTGGADVLLLDHSSSATNTLSLPLTPLGVTLADLGSSVIFSSDDTSIATASAASTGAGCTVKAAQAGSPAAFTYATGVVTVTVTASVGSPAIPLTYEKEIMVMDLVVKRGTYVVPDNGNIIAEGSTVTLTAELKGPPAGSTITYEWEGSPLGLIAPNTTSGNSTTLTTGSGIAAGSSSPITVKATYKGTEYSREIGWSVGFSGSVADFLSATFPPNTLATACTVKITGTVSAADLQAIATALGDSSDSSYKGVYVKLDLSAVTGLSTTGDNTFEATGGNSGLATYLTGIMLPNSSGFITVGMQAFNGCTNLTGNVEIPTACQYIGSGAFAGTGITLSDADPSRTWYRYITANPVPTWTGSLNEPEAFSTVTTYTSNVLLQDHPAP